MKSISRMSAMGRPRPHKQCHQSQPLPAALCCKLPIIWCNPIGERDFPTMCQQERVYPRSDEVESDVKRDEFTYEFNGHRWVPRRSIVADNKSGVSSSSSRRFSAARCTTAFCAGSNNAADGPFHAAAQDWTSRLQIKTRRVHPKCRMQGYEDGCPTSDGLSGPQQF